MSEHPYWDKFWQRRLSRRSLLRTSAVAGTGLAAAGIVGCGDDDAAPSPTSSGGGTSTGGAPTTAAATGAPKTGGTAVTFDPGEPPSFDDYLTFNYRSKIFMSTAYPRMYKLKTAPGTSSFQYDVEPDFSESLEQPDDMTYIFTLKSGKWENKAPVGGRAVTADDVVQSWSRFSQIHPNRAIFSDVQSVTSPSAGKVTFSLSRPLGPFLRHLGAPHTFFIMPPELVENEASRQTIVSAGPYLMTNYEAGVGASFSRNPDYYNAPLPYIDGLEMRFISDPSTSLSAILTKDIDFTTWYAPAELNRDQVEDQLPDAVLAPGLALGNAWLGVDGSNPVFKDPRVRQALSMMLDRDAILQVTSNGKGSWQTAFMPIEKYWLDPKDESAFGPNAKYFKHDLAEAQALMSAAGYADGLKDLPLHVTNLFHATRKQENELVQAQLRAGKVETNLVLHEFAEFFPIAVTTANWDGLAYSANQFGTDPNEWLTLLYNPDGARLIVKDLLVGDTQLQTMIDGQKRESDEATRIDLCNEIQRYLAEKMYSIPALQPHTLHVHQGHVKNLNFVQSYGPGQEWMDDIWLDK
jgi:peptide/nickel transport system substrate-binding protein